MTDTEKEADPVVSLFFCALWLLDGRCRPSRRNGRCFAHVLNPFY